MDDATIAAILAELRTRKASLPDCEHEPVDGMCIRCGTPYRKPLTVPVRRWVIARDAKGRDASYWQAGEADAEPVRKLPRRHIPRKGASPAPHDLSDVADSRMPEHGLPSGITYLDTPYASQGPLADDRKTLPRTYMKTGRSPSYIPVTEDMTDAAGELERNRRRHSTVGYSRDLVKAIVAQLRRMGYDGSEDE